MIHRSSGEHCGAGRGIFVHFAKPTEDSGEFSFVPNKGGMVGGATNDFPRVQPLKKDRTESGTMARHAGQCGQVKDSTMLGRDDFQGSGLFLFHLSVEMSHPGWPGWRNPPVIPGLQHWGMTTAKVAAIIAVALHPGERGDGESLDATGTHMRGGRCGHATPYFDDGVRLEWPGRP